MTSDHPNNRTLVFRFPVLDVPGSMANYCRNGVLYFLGGDVFLGRLCGNYTYEVIVTSPFNTNSIVLHLQGGTLEKPLRGISGTYNYSDCGGVLNGEVDFTSPGYPTSYPPNTDCHWIIYSADGDALTLTVTDLRLEADCTKDYLLVRNGPYYSSPPVGRFCGTHSPAPIRSSESVVNVMFHSDAFGTAPGFRITTREEQRGCGGLIHHTSGNFMSPGRPSHYENDVECRWVIEFPPGYLVRLDFVGRFDLEMGTNCDKDYLLLEEYDERGNDWSAVARKCGSQTPAPVVSKSRKMRVTFHSNERITADGFHVNYSASCGGNFTSLEGEILSPNYPGFYGNDLNCVYTIGRANQYVSMTFDDYFSIEGQDDCRYDYVLISHKNATTTNVQGPFCGTERPVPRTMEGPVNVTFFTDDMYAAQGFRIYYEIVACGAVLTDPSGIIATPKTHSGYLDAMDCTWQIIAPQDKVIALRFSFFDIRLNYKCWHDYLDIRDGYIDNGTLVAKVCGNDSLVVKSTDNVISLKLRIFTTGVSRGFTAFYYATYGIAHGCGNNLDTRSGSFQSLDLNSDGLYEPNLDCRWTIFGDNDDLVYRVTFERFYLEPSSNSTCIYDYVEIREDIDPNSGLVGRYCGSTLPDPIITSGNRMSVLFHSDEMNNQPGFKLNFESVPSACGPSLLTVVPGVPQTLTSPNYPGAYPSNLRCKWTIMNNSTGVNNWRVSNVQITFTDFDVPCSGDYVQVQKIATLENAFYRHSSAHPHNLIRLCGPTHAHDIIAQSGMVLSFQSIANSQSSRGFSMTYKEASCNRTYTSDSGVVSSFSTSARRNAGVSCNIKISVSPEKTISAYFSHLQLYAKDATCESNSFKVYDGPNNNARLIGTYCGYEAPNPVFSSGNSLYFESYMPQQIGFFYLIYMANDQDRGCGGSIYAEEGTISSPLYPQTYSKVAECTWYISVPGYHSVSVEFKTLILNSTAGCDSNYVELYDGHAGLAAERVARYCGSDNPGVHVSRSNQVMVKFKSDPTNHGPGFLLNFKNTNFLPDTSLNFIQNHPEIEYSENTIYL